jgi:hypothetical protein
MENIQQDERQSRNSTITQETLKSLVHYNPVNGAFTALTGPKAGQTIGWISCHGSCQYRKIAFGNQEHFAHRLAWLYMTGSFPSNMIDHVNRDGTDNRWVNLRAVTASQNSWNAVSSVNTSGRKGVWFRKDRQKWEAAIQANGTRIHLGLFFDFREACQAREAGERYYHGQYRFESIYTVMSHVV